MSVATATTDPARPQPVTSRPEYPAKRLFDAGAALVLLLALSPVVLAVALAVRLSSPGPVLFWQKRVGRGGAVFTLCKFRTMYAGTPTLSTAEMQAQKLNPVTPVGAVLRRTSLDELPQLWNVLAGQMSLVGPRPALPSQTPLNALREAAGVHALRPGITGWAQVNGRDDLDDAAKCACDTHYLTRISPRLDLTILLRTLVSVWTGRGTQ